MNYCIIISILVHGRVTYKLCPDVKEWIKIMISYEKKKNIYYYIFSLDVFSLSNVNNTEKNVWDLNPGHLPVFILSMYYKNLLLLSGSKIYFWQSKCLLKTMSFLVKMIKHIIFPTSLF